MVTSRLAPDKFSNRDLVCEPEWANSHIPVIPFHGTWQSEPCNLLGDLIFWIFVVHRIGKAYDARVRGSNRKFRIVLLMDTSGQED